jgi:hypothetical protein
MPKLAISYRRSDSSAITGRIFDRLSAHYGREQVFMDIDNIPFGIDFRSHIQSVLQKADMLIVVIGPHWLGVDAAGTARMAQEADPVRAEVEMALARGLPLLPVLVDGARMPEAAALPASFKEFAYLNAAEVATGRDFHPHVDRLIAAIDRTVAALQGDAPALGAPAAPAPSVKTTASWLVDLARYLLVPIVTLLVAHHVTAYMLDLNSAYLRVISIAVPLVFGLLLAWQGGRGTLPAVAIGVALGLITILGMNVSDSLSSGDKILPQTRVDWQDEVEYVTSIALSFIVGHALGRMLGAKLRQTKSI